MFIFNLRYENNFRIKVRSGGGGHVPGWALTRLKKIIYVRNYIINNREHGYLVLKLNLIKTLLYISIRIGHTHTQILYIYLESKSWKIRKLKFSNN